MAVQFLDTRGCERIIPVFSPMFLSSLSMLKLSLLRWPSIFMCGGLLVALLGVFGIFD
jgi:hypothetical protein